jgi:ankyrin repeat protein
VCVLTLCRPDMTTTISPALGEGRDVTLFDLVLRNSEDALDAYKGSLHVVDRHGFSAVMVAAMHRCPVALRWLVRAGAGRSGVDRKEWTQSLTALMFACIGWAVAPAAGSCLDDPTCASILIEAGANPLHQNANGDTALHWAVHSGFVRVAAYLASLEYVVDAAGGRPASDMLTIRNAKGELPADVAGTREGSLEVANALRAALEGRVSLRVYCVYTCPCAALCGAMWCCSDVLQVWTFRCGCFGGVDVQGGGALVVPAVAVSEFASRARSLEPRLKLKKPTGEVVTATVGEYLGACARRGDVIALGKFPLYLDAVDLDGRVLLHAACTQRREDVVQWYLDTAPAARTQLAARDDMSCTCMHFAAAKGSRGADVDADPRCMQLVAAAGADLNAVDNTGGTPLHVAAQNGFGAIVRFLCGLPACALAVVDVHGRSAAASARLAGFHDVAAIIEAEVCACVLSGVADLAVWFAFALDWGEAHQLYLAVSRTVRAGCTPRPPRPPACWDVHLARAGRGWRRARDAGVSRRHGRARCVWSHGADGGRTRQVRRWRQVAH